MRFTYVLFEAPFEDSFTPNLSGTDSDSITSDLAGTTSTVHAISDHFVHVTDGVPFLRSRQEEDQERKEEKDQKEKENEVPSNKEKSSEGTSSLNQGESPIETEHSQQVDPSFAYGDRFDKAKIEKPDLKDKYHFISLFLKWIDKNFDPVFEKILSRNPEWLHGTIVKGIQATEKKLKLLVEKDSSKDLFPGFEENTVKETLFDFLSGKDPQNEIVDFLKEKHLYIFLLGSIFNETRLKKSCKAVA